MLRDHQKQRTSLIREYVRGLWPTLSFLLAWTFLNVLVEPELSGAGAVFPGFFDALTGSVGIAADTLCGSLAGDAVSSGYLFSAHSNVIERVPHQIQAKPEYVRYLRTKAHKLRHIFLPEFLL